MEHQAHVQADSDVGDVSANGKGESAAVDKGSKERLLVSRAAVSDGCRDGPRCRVAVRWAIDPENRRSECQALPTPEHLGAGKLSDERHSALFARARRRSPPPQHVFLRKTNGASA